MSGLSYPHAEHPAPGTTMELAPGVRWLTMPMGGSLNHINLYLLEDTDGWWVVDTGLSLPQTRELWHEIFTTRTRWPTRDRCDLHPHAPGPHRPGADDH